MFLFKIWVELINQNKAEAIFSFLTINLSERHCVYGSYVFTSRFSRNENYQGVFGNMIVKMKMLCVWVLDPRAPINTECGRTDMKTSHGEWRQEDPGLVTRQYSKLVSSSVSEGFYLKINWEPRKTKTPDIKCMPLCSCKIRVIYVYLHRIKICRFP